MFPWEREQAMVETFPRMREGTVMEGQSHFPLSSLTPIGFLCPEGSCLHPQYLRQRIWRDHGQDLPRRLLPWLDPCGHPVPHLLPLLETGHRSSSVWGSVSTLETRFWASFWEDTPSMARTCLRTRLSTLQVIPALGEAGAIYAKSPGWEAEGG